MKVCVVAEYYPRRRDPVLGIWAHRQAVAASERGAEVRVLVLERPVPPAASLRRPWKLPGAVARMARQPGRDLLDGIEVRYVRFMAGDRAKTYTTWHERAAAPLAEALAALREEWPFELIHAHYALPAGGAARPYATENGVPLVVSVHGGDVLGPLLQNDDARARVAEVVGGAAEVLCNSRSTLDRVAQLLPSDERLRVVHLGASAPDPLPPKRDRPTIATLAHVIPRKRHADVLEALHQLDGVDWLVIGDGPELGELRRGVEQSGLSERVQFTGQLAPEVALAELATAHVMALPSEDEAFGVAYVEALACGLPAIGLESEGGPREIASLGEGMLLVPPRDPQAIADAVRRALEDPWLATRARTTAREHFSWERCGRDTVAAYRDALAA
jgi:glycosyltransferase involved in cell wall biosynthesis